MIHQWSEVTDKAEAQLQSDLSSPYGFVQKVVRRGAKIYRCTSASKPDLGALRIILGARSMAELRRELEEQKRRAQQEADVLEKRITEMQSKLEDDRHASGKASATYNVRPVPTNSRVFLVGSLTHLAL